MAVFGPAFAELAVFERAVPLFFTAADLAVDLPDWDFFAVELVDRERCVLLVPLLLLGLFCGALASLVAAMPTTP